MNTHEAIRSRRTTHSFTREPVSNEVLERALQAANHAPCHKLTFPWRFTLVGPETRERLAELAVELKSASRKLTDEEIGKIREKILLPARLVVAGQVRSENSDQSREDYAACACAIQNMMVSLAAEDTASKWSTGSITRHPETYRLVDADPVLEELIGFIWVGHGTLERPIKRPTLKMFLRKTT